MNQRERYEEEHCESWRDWIDDPYPECPECSRRLYRKEEIECVEDMGHCDVCEEEAAKVVSNDGLNTNGR